MPGLFSHWHMLQKRRNDRDQPLHILTKTKFLFQLKQEKKFQSVDVPAQKKDAADLHRKDVAVPNHAAEKERSRNQNVAVPNHAAEKERSRNQNLSVPNLAAENVRGAQHQEKDVAESVDALRLVAEDTGAEGLVEELN